MSKVQKLEEFFKSHLPHIRYVTPSSTDYGELRRAYIIDHGTTPIAIARPRNAEEVTSLVKYAVNAGIEITVRTGGHDLYGRCFAQDALAIDLRDISFVHIADDQSSVAIGGGVLHENLVTTLATHKLATAIGTISSVGYRRLQNHCRMPRFANFSSATTKYYKY